MARRPFPPKGVVSIDMLAHDNEMYGTEAGARFLELVHELRPLGDVWRIDVPWKTCDEPKHAAYLWLVCDSQQREMLAAFGICRSEIWTVYELQGVFEVTNPRVIALEDIFAVLQSEPEYEERSINADRKA